MENNNYKELKYRVIGVRRTGPQMNSDGKPYNWIILYSIAKYIHNTKHISHVGFNTEPLIFHVGKSKVEGAADWEDLLGREMVITGLPDYPIAKAISEPLENWEERINELI